MVFIGNIKKSLSKKKTGTRIPTAPPPATDWLKVCSLIGCSVRARAAADWLWNWPVQPLIGYRVDTPMQGGGGQDQG